MPSSNNSKVIVERAVLVHSILDGLHVKAEKLIIDNILAAAENKDDRGRLPFPSIIYRLLYANGIPRILEDELAPVERPITQEIQQQAPNYQQAPPPPPQAQHEQVQQGQPLPERFNWEELNQQFQGMKVNQAQFYQNIQELQNQFFQDFRNQQTQYKQEFQDLRVQLYRPFAH
ncbi:hypothetical protein PIB30_101715 [Stylosanthes scabra]|uniref:Uncharacterized protein n=1 Tax=Stylosanthes scabra TaxID=79078 RepID=A0ABU6WVZ4_9FABA|nr:hypothetical protein [Stylosanthes scabra]